MKKLVIVRHGAYGPSEGLNDIGKQQIRLLGEQLGNIISGDSIMIFTSTAERAHQSAEILGKIFGVKNQLCEFLHSDCEHKEDHQKVLELVCTHKDSADVVILVTHLEYGENFPLYFAMREFGEVHFSGFGIKQGQAWVIDCQAKDMTLVAPDFR